MTISKLDSDNASRVAKFFNDNFADGWTEKMLSSAFSTGRFNCIGAIKDEEIVGVVTFSYSDDTADIEDIVVKKELRRKGVGAKLLTAALNQIKSSDIYRTMLEVRESNIAAIKLYEKFGFNKISVRKKYYFDGENAVVMLKG